MSVRWAILLLLSETGTAMAVAEIATALQAGGIQSKAADFNANVTSVLSGMKTKREEVDVAEGRWRITDVGLSAIDYIRATKLKKVFPKRSAVDGGAPTTPITKGASMPPP